MNKVFIIIDTKVIDIINILVEGKDIMHYKSGDIYYKNQGKFIFVNF